MVILNNNLCFYEGKTLMWTHSSVVLFSYQTLVFEWESEWLLQLLYMAHSLEQLVRLSAALHCGAMRWRVNDIHI